MSKPCPRCQAPNQDGAACCVRCNGPLGASPAANLCPAGRHPMDPGWGQCPYCNADPAPPHRQEFVEAPPREVTVGESFPAAENAAPPATPAGAAPIATHRTVFDAGGDSATGQESGGVSDRRIVALLVTYTWDPAGAVFPVREGRNYIGRDEDCEIRVACDSQMSGRHTTIVVRNGEFWIDDEKSMNGTFVGTHCILTKQPLADQARIRTGATAWRFIAIPWEDA